MAAAVAVLLGLVLAPWLDCSLRTRFTPGRRATSTLLVSGAIGSIVGAALLGVHRGVDVAAGLTVLLTGIALLLYGEVRAHRRLLARAQGSSANGQAH